MLAYAHPTANSTADPSANPPANPSATPTVNPICQCCKTNGFGGPAALHRALHLELGSERFQIFFAHPFLLGLEKDANRA